MQQYYDTLGIKIEATEEEVKKAYREKAKEFHPDKHINLSEGMRALAEKEFKRVTEAYEKITEFLNIHKKTTKDSKRNESSDWTYTSQFSEDVEIPDELLFYSKLLKLRKEFETKGVDYAYNIYKESKRIEVFLRTGIDEIKDRMKNCLGSYIHLLVDYEIYDYNSELLLRSYKDNFFQKFYEFEEMLETINTGINFSYEIETMQRLVNKEIRRIRGKGTIRNIFEKTAISIRKGLKKQELYESELIMQNLVICIEYYFDMLHKVICSFVNLPSPEEVFDNEKTLALLENIKYAGENKKQEILSKALSLNPFCEDVYEVLLNHYGDKEKQLEKFGGKIGIDVLNIKGYLIAKEVEGINIDEITKGYRASLVKINSKIKRVYEKILFFGMEEKDSELYKELLKIRDAIELKIKTNSKEIQEEDARLFKEKTKRSKLENECVLEIYDKKIVFGEKDKIYIRLENYKNENSKKQKDMLRGKYNIKKAVDSEGKKLELASFVSYGFDKLRISLMDTVKIFFNILDEYGIEYESQEFSHIYFKEKSKLELFIHDYSIDNFEIFDDLLKEISYQLTYNNGTSYSIEKLLNICYEEIDKFYEKIKNSILDSFEYSSGFNFNEMKYIYDKRKSVKIIESLKIFSNEQKLEKLLEALKSYPFDTEIYEVLIKNYKDLDSDIKRVASFFGIVIVSLEKELVKERIEKNRENKKDDEILEETILDITKNLPIEEAKRIRRELESEYIAKRNLERKKLAEKMREQKKEEKKEQVVFKVDRNVTEEEAINLALEKFQALKGKKLRDEEFREIANFFLERGISNGECFKMLLSKLQEAPKVELLQEITKESKSRNEINNKKDEYLFIKICIVILIIVSGYIYLKVNPETDDIKNASQTVNDGWNTDVLNSKLKEFQLPITQFKTNDYTIRIDKISDEYYRMAIWKKRASISEEPSWLLSEGVLIDDGYGNKFIQFINANNEEFMCCFDKNKNPIVFQYDNSNALNKNSESSKPIVYQEVIEYNYSYLS